VNRLGGATSPYLLQHAENPVDWWPWCTEAFDRARQRDVPVLISVGYAACHWCHVMAHESFEDPAVAAVVNDLVVPIKVDREERPDVDAVYLTATQALTGQGGWPMTVFATPDGEPFYCGTYFPKPAFVDLVRAVSQTWATQRDAVLRQGAAVVAAIGGTERSGEAVAGRPAAALTPDLTAAALTGLDRAYDREYGGFGHAPKFPPHLCLLFLLRHHRRTGNPQALEMVQHTAEAMARGGMVDQLAGGFARYATDERWLVPHFEKMLYDNALLLRVYTGLWRYTGDRLAARVARETAEFLLDDLALPGGGFASSLDADTGGVEGATYVWTRPQLAEVLGPADADWAADLFDVTPTGTFEHGTSVLRLARDVDAAGDGTRQRWLSVRQRLRAARDRRPQPPPDTKLVAAWNGLAVAALVEYATTARALAGPDGSDPVPERAAAAAVEAGQVLARRHLVDGRLRRVSRDGVVGAPAGVLEDHGAVAEAFCALHQLTVDGTWLDLAGGLLDTVLARFADPRGGFFDTADDAEALVARPADPTDNATPSGLSAVVSAMISYTALTGDLRYRERAEQAVATVVPLVRQHPRFAGYACAAIEALLSGPVEVAVADPDPGSALTRAAWRLAPPGAVVVAGAPDAPGVPLLRGRAMRDGLPRAYVCRGFVCDAPVTTVEDLAAVLRAG
jgi:uncharacterized protein